MTSSLVSTPPVSGSAALRCGIYDRVSKDSTGTGRSVAEQQTANHAVAEAHGWRTVLTRADALSASRFAKTKVRPGWEQIEAAVAGGQLDVLIVWEVSRGSRDLAVWAALLAVCRSAGVLIHVTSHHRTYDPRVPRDWRSLAEEAVDSGYETEKSSERIRRALAANREDHRPHGRVKYGYVRRYDPATKRLVAQEVEAAEAAIVREIVQRIGTGHSITSIAHDLTDRGVSTPHGVGQWRTRTVRQIALSETYLGLDAALDADGEPKPGTGWPAIVHEVEHARVKRILLAPERNVTRHGRAVWLLSHIARCGRCGLFMQGLRRDGGAAPFYSCERRCVSINAEALDEHVTTLIVARLADPDVFTALVTGGDDHTVVAAREAEEVLRARLDEHYAEAAAGNLSAGGLAAVERRILADITAAQERTVRAVAPAAIVGLLDPAGREDVVRDRFESQPLAARREVIRLLLGLMISPATKRGNQKFDVTRVQHEWISA